MARSLNFSEIIRRIWERIPPVQFVQEAEGYGWGSIDVKFWFWHRLWHRLWPFWLENLGIAIENNGTWYFEGNLL